MRTVTASANTILNTNMGTEWIVLLEVDWVDGGTITYSDQEFENARPLVIEMGGFDGSMMLTGASDSQELDITLDDIDGHLRTIYETNDIHKRPARVYLQPKSLSSQHKILVFKGEIVTPIEWDESQRSVKFNVLSKLNSTQVGFSMEEGDFPNIPDEALGKAWPLVFGQVCHLPAVKVRAPRRGYLETGVGIHDFTLEVRLCQAMKIQCPSQSTGNQQATTQGADNIWTTSTFGTIGPDLECVNRRFGEICKLRDLYNQQIAYEYDSFTVYNGTAFPQNKKVTIYVDDAIFTGTFSGNVFTVISRQHPEYATFNHQPCRDVPTMGYGTTLASPQIGGTNCNSAGGYWLVQPYGGGAAGQGASATWVPNDAGTAFTPNQTQGQAFESCDEALVGTPGLVGGPKDSWEYYDSLEESDFFWAPAGTEVYMESENEILYIASLLPGTVDMVAAYRQAPNGFRYLTEVPTDRYTVYETDYEGYQVVEIGMDKQLSHYVDPTTKESEGWEDDIYVSFTSSIGPNPCDIIEWLVNKYTDLTIDSTSFASVKSYLTNYPQNFYLISRPDVYDVINDIAYQSRCAVYVRNDTIYIRYLSLEPTSVRTISQSDILSGTFVESLSETEDVYTTHNIVWSKGGAAVRDDQTPERKLVLKYNVDKYGTVEDDYDYFTYNIYDLVLKSGTFWLIRKANSWKKIAFDLPLKHLDLDVGDCILLDFPQFNSDPIKVVIEQFTVNPDDHTVSLECWTPIRSGEMNQYYWAWPSQQSPAQIWPLSGDTHGGGGYNFSVTPPLGHLLTGGAHRDDQLIISSGDLHPSDLDDSLPSVTCELSDYLNFNEKTPEIIAKEIAQSAARQATENQISGGGNAGGSGSAKARSVDGCGVGNGCNYKVRVQWHTSKAQGQATAQGGAKRGGPCGGPCICVGGCPSCFGPIWTVCHTFGSPSGAHAFAGYMKAMYGETDDSWWECNETRILQTWVENGTHGGDTFGQCEDISSGGGANQSNQGDKATQEKKEPTGKTGDSSVLW